METMDRPLSFVAIPVKGDAARVAATPAVKHTVLVDGKLIHHIYATDANRTLRLMGSFDTLEALAEAGFGSVPSILITVVEAKG